MSGIAAFAQNAYPLRFTPRISSQLSALASTTVWYFRMPALLTRMSSRPKRSAAWRTKPVASASRSMCASTNNALGPISAATRVPRSTPRWLDPGATETAFTPFMVLYALHDALVKPMPKGQTTPSLAESWTASPDWKTYEFVLRNGIKFHNGDPVTAEDVRFSFERYRGGAAKLLKDRVKDVQVV